MTLPRMRLWPRGKSRGFVEAGPPTDLGSLMMPVAQRPGDQVPDPRNPIGVLAQEAIRNGDMSVKIREVSEPVKNQYGDEVTTVTMQDGSKQVLTKYDPFDWPSKGELQLDHAVRQGRQQGVGNQFLARLRHGLRSNHHHVAQRCLLHDVDGPPLGQQKRGIHHTPPGGSTPRCRSS